MSAFVPIDQDVRERIRTDLGTNLCVEAGAGTGKTTVLVERIVEVLRTGHATRGRDRGHHLHREGRRRARRPRAPGARGGARTRPRTTTSASASTPRSPACTARTSRRSTPSPPASCASGPSRPGSTPASRCSTTSPRGSHFDDAYDEWLQRAPRRGATRDRDRGSPRLRPGADPHARRDRARAPLAAAARRRARTAPAPVDDVARPRCGEAADRAAASCCPTSAQDEAGVERHARRSSTSRERSTAVERRPGRARPRDPLPRAEDCT